jgi:hypothetical protein
MGEEEGERFNENADDLWYYAKPTYMMRTIGISHYFLSCNCLIGVGTQH